MNSECIFLKELPEMGEVRATGANQVWALCGRILLGVMSGRLLWGKRKKKEVTPGELEQW